MQVASLAAMTSSPRGLRLQFGDRVLRAAAQVEHLFGVFGENLARGGERDAAAEALEERRSQFLFQLPYLRADRRLRAVTGLGGFGEALQPDDLQERMELIEIHNLPECPLTTRFSFPRQRRHSTLQGGSVKFQIGGIENFDFPCTRVFGMYYNKGSGWCGSDNGIGQRALVWWS